MEEQNITPDNHTLFQKYKKWILGGLVLCIVLLIIMRLTGGKPEIPTSPAKPAQLETPVVSKSPEKVKEEASVARLDKIKNIAPEILETKEYFPSDTSGAKEDKPLLLISYFQKNIWNGASWVNSAGNGASWINSAGFASQKILQRISSDYPNEYSKVKLEFYIPSLDRYGNADKEVGMSLEYNMSDIQKINWSNASSWMLLNLANVDFKKLGREAEQGFCADSSNRKNADIFCSR